MGFASQNNGPRHITVTATRVTWDALPTVVQDALRTYRETHPGYARTAIVSVFGNYELEFISTKNGGDRVAVSVDFRTGEIRPLNRRPHRDGQVLA